MLIFELLAFFVTPQLFRPKLFLLLPTQQPVFLMPPIFTPLIFSVILLLYLQEPFP
jgi:hypothetical protein